MTSVAICIATHRRPQGLARLLAGLDRQEIAPLVDHQVRIVVVDNAADQSARPVVDAFRRRCRFEVSYRLEPRRGECFARNLAVASAGEASHLAFIDDDEEPDPRWLAALLEAQRRTGAAIVCGAARSVLPDGTPAHVAAHLQRAERTLGEIDLDRLVMTGGAGNLLVTAEVFEAFGPAPFPEEAPLAGGSDREFMLRARMRGFRATGAPDAIIHHIIPAARTRPRHILVRGFTSGQIHMRRMAAYRAASWQPLLLLGKALAGVAVWSGVALACCWHRGRAFDACVRVVIHGGRIAGFLRLPSFQRYRVTDGS